MQSPENPTPIGRPDPSPGRIQKAGRSSREREGRDHPARSSSNFLVSAMALAGLSPLGQTFAQFMIVWQR